MTGATAFQKAATGGRINHNERQDFLSLYPNRIQAILRPPGCKTWVSVSKHWSLTNEQIESAINLSAESVWGCRWGEHTRFAVFDIDAGSKYHNAQDLLKLSDALEGVGLAATVYQSSDSGGWHVYLFFDDWQQSSEVQEALKAWLTVNRYVIRNGTLEVFPSGNGLRFPLQHGFAWLDDKSQVIAQREELTTEAAISRFLTDLESKASNWTISKNRIESQLKPIDRAAGAGVQEHEKAISLEGFEGLWNYRLIPEKYQDGRQYWHTGLTANGQRHDAIMAVEHYLWHGDDFAGAGIVPALPGEWNDEGRYRLILAWLKDKHNGFCNHINRGNWRKVEAQIRRAVKWRRPSGAFQVRIPYMLTENSIERLIALSKSTGRTWTSEDLRKGNDGRAAQAREKIEAAVQELIDKGRRVTGRQIMRVTGCSYHTVKRHLDIWGISPVVALPRAAGDQNPFLDLIGAGGSVPSPGGSSPGSEKEFLPFVCPGDSRQTEVVSGESCSEELAPIVITPPLLLPGSKPTSAHPASSPSPAGCFASLDAGALVRRNSGRTADDAGGSEPGSSGLVHPGWSVCYTDAIAGSIKEREGATSTVVALASFGTKSKKKKTAPDTTNYKFLTTSRLVYSSGLTDEFSLIKKPSCGAAPVDVSGLFLLGSRFEVSLHQPTASAPEITSACLQCCVRVFRFSIVTQSPKNGARSGCRQLLGKHLGILLGLDVRGPPKCRQAQQANLCN